jgi:hypothetical protein
MSSLGDALKSLDIEITGGVRAFLTRSADREAGERAPWSLIAARGLLELTGARMVRSQ